MLLDYNDLKKLVSLKSQLATVKAQEMALRKQIATQICGTLQAAGTHTQQVEEMEVAVSIGESLSVQREDVMSVELTQQEQECILWKPSIRKAAYDQLPTDSVLRSITLLKYGAPAVRITGAEVM